MNRADRSGAGDTAVAPAVRGVVSRPALFGRIGAAGRVVVVSAPAGSGKTFRLPLGPLAESDIIAIARDHGQPA